MALRRHPSSPTGSRGCEGDAGGDDWDGLEDIPAIGSTIKVGAMLRLLGEVPSMRGGW